MNVTATLTRMMAAACLVLLAPQRFEGGEDIPARPAAQAPLPEAERFSHDAILPPNITSDGHISTTRNGVHFDVYFNKGAKANAAIYAINTGRKQLVLTPTHHKAILEDLLRRRFTVIVADFRDKKLAGLELEKYVVQLTTDAREAADGVLHPSGLLRPPLAPRVPPGTSKTDTFANDYFTLMPGFTVERDVAWFRYGDIPAAFRREIAERHDKPFHEAEATKVNTYDIIYPVYGPAVGVLTNYASDEKGREDYYPLPDRYLVQAFALKNLAIVHQQYFNDPVAGYPKGYGYYGDQFAVCFIRHLKGRAPHYRIDPDRICCFGHSKGSEVPGMLVNKLRSSPEYLFGKAVFSKIAFGGPDKTLHSPFADVSTEIAGAILGAGVANNELGSDKMLPWQQDPTRNISPFFLYSDHRELTRQRTRAIIAKAEAHGVMVDTAELDSHTWPAGEAYDRASAFADRILGLDNE